MHFAPPRLLVDDRRPPSESANEVGIVAPAATDLELSYDWVLFPLLVLLFMC